MKVGLLDKKVESADTECAKKVGVEREEQDRLRRVMDEQERWGLCIHYLPQWW